ncbi:MAG TPA: ATP-binding protein, partial [Chloroflexota bacterium]
GYQEPSVQTVVAIVSTGMYLTTPGLAWTFPVGAAPDFWEPMFTYLNFCRAREADFEVDGRRYGVFAHDWRIEPAEVWLERMGERELDLDFRPGQVDPVATTPLVALSQPAFFAAVRQALRHYTRPDALASNPLLRSRVVRDRAGATPSPEALRALLREAAATLTTSPRGEKLYRALYHTYFQPSPTQEAAAELLGLPFSTYRFHLGRGVERVADWLWQRELYGPEGTPATGTPAPGFR